MNFSTHILSISLQRLYPVLEYLMNCYELPQEEIISTIKEFYSSALDFSNQSLAYSLVKLRQVFYTSSCHVRFNSIPMWFNTFIPTLFAYKVVYISKITNWKATIFTYHLLFIFCYAIFKTITWLINFFVYVYLIRC